MTVIRMMIEPNNRRKLINFDGFFIFAYLPYSIYGKGRCKQYSAPLLVGTIYLWLQMHLRGSYSQILPALQSNLRT
jgi:hypothetical protein